MPGRYFRLGAFAGVLVRCLGTGNAGVRRRVAGWETVFQGFVAAVVSVSLRRHGESFRPGANAGHRCNVPAAPRFAFTPQPGHAKLPGMSAPVRLGMLTPSSNTTLEPVTTAMLAGLPSVSVHFSRFRVTEIALTGDALAQFDDRPILAAAELLAHAKVDVIAWNGTSSGWLGFDADIRLCERIESATGIRASTSMLALNEILAATGVKRFGLVTPYVDAVQQRIVANYATLGITCDAERHLGIQDNFAFARVSADTLTEMIRAVAADKPDAIGIICTNLQAAPLVSALEAELGIPIYDTIATAVWKSLRLAGVDPVRVTGWGRIFGVVV
ncbi:MAG: Maleate isomerase [Rhodopila sp.]|nr:Maleate isomerase [Rhodopila sp.]